MCGAFLGYGLLVILTPPTILELSGPSFGVLKPMDLITIPQALCIEFIATGILIWFCCGVWDPRNAQNQDSVPLRFAFALAGLVSATVRFIFFIVTHLIFCFSISQKSLNDHFNFWRQISLAEVCNMHAYSLNFFLNNLPTKNLSRSSIGMNPARSTAPAAWTGDFEFLWVSGSKKNQYKDLFLFEKWSNDARAAWTHPKNINFL